MAEDLSKLSVAMLRERCRENKISPLPKKKQDLIAALQKIGEGNENTKTKDTFKEPSPKTSPKSNNRGKKRGATKSTSKSKSNSDSGSENDAPDDNDDDNDEPAAKRRKITKNTKSPPKSKSKSKTKETKTTKAKGKNKEIENKENEDNGNNNNNVDDTYEEDDDIKQDTCATKTKTKENNKSNNNGNDNNKDTIKIICFNINGVRAAHKNGLLKYLESENGDIICFSEMKADFSQNPCNFGKYQVIWNDCTEKKGYAGSCILTRIKPISIKKGIGCEDAQGRAIIIEFEKFYLVNTYVPNSGQKLKFSDRRKKWDVKMKSTLKSLQDKKPIIWTGDLNVAVEDWDVYDGETNKNRCKTAGFTPYERENFRGILKDLSLHDSWRELYPNATKEEGYTFFTARSRGKDMKKDGLGWRLDYFVVSKNILPLINDLKINKDIECSDHVPLVLTMKNPNTNL